MEKRYVIGVDFGSDSARALIMDALSGQELAESTAGYPRWLAGKYQDAKKNMFRQHPLDYLEAMTACVRAALDKAGDAVREGIAALSVDTTGSTPCPVNREGTPLALFPEFEDDPDAMFHLWKDHTAVSEAEEITAAFQKNADGIDYTAFQGNYASEWYWAKILHTIRGNAKVRASAWSWTEHSDWLPNLLVGDTRPERMYRCACAAGHKAYWHSAWGGLPSEACLAQVDPELARVRGTYGANCQPSTHCLGKITPAWAERLSLREGVLIGGSSFDAHAGAVGAGVSPSRMVVNLGTSAVNMFVVDADALKGRSIASVCGAAENSILPGFVGLESGQAAFGDVYAWFKRVLTEPFAKLLSNVQTTLDHRQQAQLLQEIDAGLLPMLQAQAEKIPPEDVPIALDWLNGRRYPVINEFVTSALTGLGIGTSAPALYRSFVQATVFGQKRIVDAMEENGIHIPQMIAVGGVAQKSSLLMQMLADALGKEVHVSQSKQACARGAAMYAAVASGIYSDLLTAQERMCAGYQSTYVPDLAMTKRYAPLYARYLQLAEYVDKQVTP